MKTKRSFLLFLILAALLVLPHSAVVYSHDGEEHGEAKTEVYSAEVARLIADVRAATADFRDLKTAEDEGYGKFLGCFKNDEVGGMGQHYVNGELVGDGELDPFLPEALVYEITDEGEKILVAFEYIVPAEIWDPEDEGREPPVLFDQEFHLKTNIPETPPVWILHIWLWTHNPDGLFADYNPLAFCPGPPLITDMTP